MMDIEIIWPDASGSKDSVVSLSDLATKIVAEHAAAHDAARMAIDHAIRCGELLIAAKAQLPHGKWESWLKKHTKITPRTSRAYMQLGGLDSEKRQRVADLPMREALKAIAQHKHLPAEERGAVVREETREKYNKRLRKQGLPELPPPGPPRLVIGTPVDYVPPPPPTREEIADGIVDQIRQVVGESCGNVTIDDVSAALQRRFQERLGGAAAAIKPVSAEAGGTQFALLKISWNAALSELWCGSSPKTKRRFLQWLEGGPADDDEDLAEAEAAGNEMPDIPGFLRRGVGGLP